MGDEAPLRCQRDVKKGPGGIESANRDPRHPGDQRLRGSSPPNMPQIAYGLPHAERVFIWTSMKTSPQTVSLLRESLLEKFPLSSELRDGTSVVVRPLARDDETRLQKFLRAVPEEERLFIKQPLSDRATVRGWCRHPDFEHNPP